MIRVAISEARAGDALARSVVNPSEPGSILIKRGTRLTARVLSALRHIGVRSLWLEGDGMGYLEEMVQEERFQAGRAVLGSLKDVFSRVSADVSYQGNFAGYRDRIVEIFGAVRENRPVYCLLDDVRGAQGDILFHGGNVCYLSLTLGLALEDYLAEQRRGGVDRELASDMAPLGLGALLHDVGKLRLPENVRNRPPWELSSREREQVQGHCAHGFRMLRPEIGAVGANMALCHHRNFDGTGYPSELEESGAHLPGGDKIHVFSRIVAVANAYEELVGYRDYLPVEALEELNCARRHHFDARLLAALNRTVPPFGFGDTVQLTSGHQAVVVDFDPERPFRPTVVLLRDPAGEPVPESQRNELPLEKYPNVRITHLHGRSVEHLVPAAADATWEELA